MRQLNAQTQPPWLIAHRGFSVERPENTFVAFDAALEQPIQAIELDLQMTRDGVPVVFHDRNMRKLGGGLRRVRNHDLAFYRRCDAGAWFDPPFPGEPPRTLAETLARYGGRCVLMLEIKRRERDPVRLRTLTEKTVEMIHECDLRQHAMLLCYELHVLEFARHLDAGLQCVWNQRQGRFAPDAGFLSAYSVDIGGLTHDFVQQTQAAGKAVVTFTCNTDRELRHALACGVNGVMSDDPRWLARRIGELSAGQT